MDADEIDIDALRAGDEQVFRQLIQQYHHTLVAVVRPLVGEASAEEVVQEAWIKIHRACGDFEGRSQLKTWLCSIALNEARMLLRRHKRETESTVSTEASPDALAERFKPHGQWAQPPREWGVESPDDLLMQDNLLDCLQKTLDALPANQRSLLRLRDIEGVAFDAICNELAITASNARVLLHRARSQVYKMIEGYQETGEC